MWEDVDGQERSPVSAGFELTTLGLLVQEHNYSATTHFHAPFLHNYSSRLFLNLLSVRG